LSLRLWHNLTYVAAAKLLSLSVSLSSLCPLSLVSPSLHVENSAVYVCLSVCVILLVLLYTYDYCHICILSDFNSTFVGLSIYLCLFAALRSSKQPVHITQAFTRSHDFKWIWMCCLIITHVKVSLGHMACVYKFQIISSHHLHKNLAFLTLRAPL